MYPTRKFLTGVRSVLLTSLFVGMATVVSAAEGNTLRPASTVQEAAQRAITNNPDVQAKWHVFLAAVDEQRVQSSGYLPRVDLQARAGRQFDHDPDPREHFDFSTATLQLSQMLYDGFFTRNAVRQFKHAKLVRYYELIESAQTVAYETVRAYEDVRRQRELIDLASDNYHQHQEVYDLIESRVQAGVGRVVDLEQIAGRLALAESNLIVEISNLHDVSARYLRVVGEMPSDNLLPAPLLDAGIPADVREALLLAYDQHPAFHASIENITATQYMRKRERADYHPELHLRVRNSWNKDLDNIPGSRQAAVVELALNYNFYQGGRTNAESRKNAHLISEAHDRREIVCRNIRQELSIAWHDVQRLGERLQNLEAHRNSTDRVRVAYRQQFEIGERSLLNLLDVENEYFESNRAAVNSYHDWTIAHARTQAGLGNLLYVMGIAREGLPSLSDLDAEPLVIDSDWLCPQVAPEFLQLASLKQSAPRTAMAVPTTASMEIVTFEAVTLFGFDSHELRPDASQALEGLVERILGSDNVIRVAIVGHTDSIGNDAYNQALSERRAETVRGYLANAGIPGALLHTYGRGETMPVSSNLTHEGRQLNRRVEITTEVR